MVRRPPLAALVLLAMGMATPGRTEIVNVLTPQVGEPPDGYTLRLGESFEGRGGNVEQYVLRSELGAQLLRQPHSLQLMGSAAYGKLGGTVNAQAMFAHLRYRWRVADPLSLLAFAQLNHDRFRRLLWRGLVGLGGELRLLRLDLLEWTAGLALMPEWEQLAPGAVDDQGLQLRASGYLAQAYQLSGPLTLTNVTFWQPALTRWDDFRLLNDLALQFKVNSYVTLRLSAHLLYDSQPPRGVVPLDWTVTQGLVLTYRELFAPAEPAR